MGKYDESVKYLTENPSLIYNAWARCNNHKYGELFQFVTPSGAMQRRHDDLICGCLTTIKHYVIRVAWTDELTEMIRSDARIPLGPDDITVEHLPIFAEWQEKIDQILGRN